MAYDPDWRDIEIARLKADSASLRDGLTASAAFPHTCQDGHELIGWRGDGELCPMCRVISEFDQVDGYSDHLQSRIDGMTVQLAAMEAEKAVLKGEVEAAAEDACYGCRNQTPITDGEGRWYHHDGLRCEAASIRQRQYQRRLTQESTTK